MHKYFPLIASFIFLFLPSCFTSRNLKTKDVRIIADPVKTSLDTITPLRKKYSDTIIIKEDTLVNVTQVFVDSSIVNIDSLIASADTNSIKLEPLEDTICIIGTGDIMPGTNYPDSRYLPPGNDCSSLFRPVRDVLHSGDITFGNLEGVFCSGGGTPKKCNDPSVCYVFRMPDEYIDCILDAGYNVLSVANNHVNDFGYEGRVSTAKHLENSGVPFAGFKDKPFVVFEHEGINYGFAAFAPHLGTMNLKDYNAAEAIVAMLDSICDIVIVSFHGGAEGRDYQHVPCTDEEYLGYNRGNVCEFAHRVIDAGADVVFGHGPHVTRAMELYNNKLICYSLGNFCTYSRFNLSGPNGFAPIVKVYTNRYGKFLSGEVISVYQAGEGGPHIDSQNRALKLLQSLSREDFPNSKLIIDDTGILYVE